MNESGVEMQAADGHGADAAGGAAAVAGVAGLVGVEDELLLEEVSVDGMCGVY